MAKIAADVEALAEALSNEKGCDDAMNTTEMREFWAREPQRSWEPKPIAHPSQYGGSPYLSVNFTQAGVKPRDQRLLAEEWCSVLPALAGVEWLWLHSKVSQPLFEAACQMPRLKSLYIKLSSIEDLAALTHCTCLRYLKLGSAHVKGLEPLSRLANLRWLQIDDLKAVSALDPLSHLTQLEGLGVTGAEFKNYTVESFEPLSSLTKLGWLHLGAVHTKDQSLKPLARLRRLKWLGLGNFFPVEEFAWLSCYQSAHICEWLQPYAKSHSSVFPCGSCRRNWKVITSGNRGRLLCPTCDSLALARHVLKFEAAKNAAVGEHGG